MILRKKPGQPLTDEFVKIVVDVKRGILAYGCELHVDCQEELLQDGSNGKDLWGANVYPKTGEVQYVSMINIRPADGNRSMEIALPDIEEKVRAVIAALFPQA